MKSNELNPINCVINGEPYSLNIGTMDGEVKPSDTLAQTLREMLLLTGTKIPCNKGECGGCTVLLNGKPTLSCSTLTIECNGADILTIEGLRDTQTGVLHPIQQAFIDVDAIQCGICTPGITLTAKALLDRNFNPTRDEVCEALAGNICRCTGYEKYVEGIMLASQRMNKARED